MPVIRCSMLGPVSVTIDGRTPPQELLWRKNLALLVYLLQSPRRTRGREHLAALLWGDKPEDKAKHSLNVALSVLRRVLGEDALDSTIDSLRLADRTIETDVDALEAAIESAAWERGAAVCAGMFCEGFAVADAPGFEDWLAAERLHWGARSVLALTRESARLLDAGRPDLALGMARRAVAIDPLSDVAARAEIRAHLVNGDRAPAIECGRLFAERLSRTTGASPEPETQALIDRGAPRVPGPRSPGVAQASIVPSRRAPLVGREHELGSILGWWNDCVSQRRSGLGIVLGPPGVGVSRLLNEGATRVRLGGGSGSVVRAIEADLADPWSGLRGLAESGLMEAPGIAAAPSAALAGIARVIPRWAEQFPAALNAAESLSFDAAFAEVVRAAGEERPVLLVVDDAHRLDPESLRFFPGLLRSTARLPVFVLLGASDSASSVGMEELRRIAGREMPGGSLPVEALTQDDLRQLATLMLPGYAPIEIDRVVRRVATDSAGLPLLAVELLHAIALGSVLQGQGEAWPAPLKTLDQTLPSGLPDPVVAAIRVGFRRFSPDAQSVLQAAAVLPERATAEEIGRVAELAPDQAHAALDELEWDGWLAAEGRGYGFVARLVRQIIADDMMTPGQRRRLLGRVADRPTARKG